MKNEPDNGETQNGQSRRNLAEDAAWLAGILDGEGCIYLWWTGPKSLRAQSYIVIGNTCFDLIKKCQDVVFRLTHKKFTISCRQHHKGNTAISGRWRNYDYYEMRIAGHSALRSLCDAVAGHLTAKRQQVSILLEFIALRKIRPNKSSYGKEEQIIIEKMRPFKREQETRFQEPLSTERFEPVN